MLLFGVCRNPLFKQSTQNKNKDRKVQIIVNQFFEIFA